ncbi:hypothetical protein, partial [Escherichia coli]|uniref:hypothetical protein n=1 Tax=Escherichia coli TaxID=562 RepID=UPI00200E7E36
MEEANYEAPSNWMEWEKKYYANYDSDVCEAVGLLQTQLMNTRPSFVIGTAVLLVLIVTTSTAMVSVQFIEIAKWILSMISCYLRVVCFF